MTEPLLPRPPEVLLGPGEHAGEGLITFNVMKLVDADPGIEAVAKAAITAVWENELSTPSTVNLVLTERLTLALTNGATVEIASKYADDTNTVTIALQTLREQHPMEDLESCVLVHAAHEARHKVQVQIDDEPPQSCHSMSTGAYAHDRHEDEAWQSAVFAYTKLNPGRWITFQVGDRVYSSKEAGHR